jgi:hypothetical protein
MRANGSNKTAMGELTPRRLLAAMGPFVLVVACGLAVYGNSLFFDYTYFDDQELVFNNQYFYDDLSNIGALFMDDMWRFTEDTYYRPLYMLTYMVDFQFTSILIHLLSASLLLVLFRTIGYSERLSLWGSLFFAVHPVLVQGVSWIPGRNDSLLGLSVIVATLAWASYWRDPGRWRWSLQSLTFFSALLIKEPAFVLPPLLLGLAWARDEQFRTKLRARWMPIALGWGLPAAAWFSLRTIAFDNPAPVLPRLVDNVAEVGLVLVHYFGKTVVPISLRTVADLHAPVWPGLLVLLALGCVLLLVRQRALLWLGLVWFVLLILPTLLAGHEFHLEERLYAPIVGILIFGLETLRSTAFHTRPIGRVVLSIWVVLFAVVAFNRSQQFADRWVLWETAVAQSPRSAFAANNLGAIYFLNQQYEQAREQYERTIELDPDEPMVRNNLGLVHHQLEDFETARAYYEEEIRRNPWYPDSHYNLGMLWLRLDQVDRAVREWEQAIEVDPDYALPYEMLARFYQDVDPAQFQLYRDELRRLGIKTFD